MSTAASVAVELEFCRVTPQGRGSYILVHLRYTSADPWAVELAFRINGRDAIVWVLARDLLQEGCREPVGDGDIQVRPGDGVVLLTLRSASGEAEFELDRAELTDFLRQTYLLVAPGAEIELVDLDRELAFLLASEI